MERGDALRTLICPLWGLASRVASGAPTARIYGDDGKEKRAEGASGVGAILLFAALLFVPLVFFWLLPMFRAFSCGDAKTTMGASGVLWGLLILFLGPLLGFIYLVGGGRCLPAM